MESAGISTPVLRTAKKVVEECMGIRPGETALIVSDMTRRDLGLPIYRAALATGCEALYMEMRPRASGGEEPPDIIAEAMCRADAVVAVTSASLTHTRARLRAQERGARIASMPFGAGSPGFVGGVFTEGGLTVDVRRMAMNVLRLAGDLGRTAEARITAKNGTDVRVGYGGRKFYADTGLALRPGDFTNLPAGEAYVAPASVEGVIVVDVSMGRIGRLASPITIEVRGGRARSIGGGRAPELVKILGNYCPEAMRIGELGIGLNPSARTCGLLLEDEKVAHTVHFALGNNATFGGDVRVPVHLDGVVADADIVVDGKKLDIGEYL